MENKETNLRQADAIVKVEGVVSEKNLEKTVVDGQDIIKGNLVIQTGELNFVTVDVRVGAKKKDGTENPAYAGIQTVMDTYVSIAEVGAAEATRVRFNRGQLRPRTSYDKQGVEYKQIYYNNTYFNSIRNDADFKPCAQFEVEVVISSIRPEIYTSGEQQGEETGRVILECWLPTYNGIEPLSIFAPAEDGIADAVSSMYEKGNTVRIFGDISNRKVIKTKTIPVMIGKPRIEETTTYVNELVVTGASAPYYEEEPADGNPAAYNLESIAAAVAVREEKLVEMKREAMNKPSTASTNQPIRKPAITSDRSLPF